MAPGEQQRLSPDGLTTARHCSWSLHLAPRRRELRYHQAHRVSRCGGMHSFRGRGISSLCLAPTSQRLSLVTSARQPASQDQFSIGQQVLVTRAQSVRIGMWQAPI